jgi:hypothetical protein
MAVYCIVCLQIAEEFNVAVVVTNQVRPGVRGVN